MTYIAAEPDVVEAYRDQTGMMHEHREDAIDANFQADVRKAINDQIAKDELLHNAPVRPMHKMVQAFIVNNPDMVRVLIGDRDAT